MQAIVVIETELDHTQKVVDELQKLKGPGFEITKIDRLINGPYQVLIRVLIEDEVETMVVERAICIIKAVKKLDIWPCQEMSTALK